jgi:hypothetical protein
LGTLSGVLGEESHDEVPERHIASRHIWAWLASVMRAYRTTGRGDRAIEDVSLTGRQAPA